MLKHSRAVILVVLVCFVAVMVMPLVSVAADSVPGWTLKKGEEKAPG